jgi:hypothetical protein
MRFLLVVTDVGFLFRWFQVVTVGFMLAVARVFILTTDITSSCIAFGSYDSELDTFVTFSKSITLFNGIAWSRDVNLKNKM